MLHILDLSLKRTPHLDLWDFGFLGHGSEFTLVSSGWIR
jgi:hypothetical protein